MILKEGAEHGFLGEKFRTDGIRHAKAEAKKPERPELRGESRNCRR